MAVTNTAIRNGVELLVSGGGYSSAVTISSGSREVVASAGTAIGTIVSSGGTIIFDGGAVSGLSVSSGGVIDLALLTYGPGDKLTFTENKAHTSGTLAVTEGKVKQSITLFGQYVAPGFSLSKDGGGGTDIHYAPMSGGICRWPRSTVSPALPLLCVQC